MADFVATYLDSGRAKRAQDFGAGLNTPIVSVEYGQGNRVADGSETALVQPFNPPIVFAMPPGLVSGETIQTTVNIPEAFRAPNSIDIHEAIYKTTDGTPIFYATRETGAMFTKPGNTGLIVPLVMTFGGDNLTGFTFNSLPVAIADESTAGLVQLGSNAEAIDANPPNTKVGSLRRTLEQTQAWWSRFGTSALATINARIDAANNQIQSLMTGKANLASPVFTGDPRAPSPATNDNDTSIATTAMVQARISERIPQILYTVNAAPTRSRATNTQTIALSESMSNFSQLLVSVDGSQGSAGVLIESALIPVAVIPSAASANIGLDFVSANPLIYGAGRTLSLDLGSRNRHILSVVGFR